MLTPRRKAALICLGLFIVLAVLAIHASPVSNHALEERLQTKAEAALYRIRADEWAQVRMDGQVAHLTGRAPDASSRDAALAALGRADWAGGLVAGGVTRVVDETTLANAEESFSLRAERIGGRLELTGFAPDADAAARIEAQADRLFSDRVAVDLRLYPGGAPVGWERAVRLMLGELSRLDAGAGLIESERVALTGLAANRQTAEAVRAAFQTAPGVFQAAVLVRTDGEPFRGEVNDAQLCAMLVRTSLAGRPVAFAPGLAELTPSARAALRRTGEVFAACTVSPLQVTVREDAGGRELALSRAEAIVDAIAEAGVDRARFVTDAAPAGAARAVRFDVTPFEPVAAPDEGTEAEDGAVSENAEDPTETNPER